MVVPIIAAEPLHFWLGILLLIQVIFQVLTGKRWLRMPFIYHRNNGWLMFIVACLHAFWGLGIWFFGFRIG